MPKQSYTQDPYSGNLELSTETEKWVKLSHFSVARKMQNRLLMNSDLMN